MPAGKCIIGFVIAVDKNHQLTQEIFFDNFWADYISWEKYINSVTY